MALGVYYSLWMECLLTARQPKSCISPAHVKTWSERKNVSFICDNFVWRHVQDLSTRVFPGSGIWLKYSAGFGKRSQDTGFDCFCGRGILQNLGTDAGLGKKTIYGYVQGLEGYSRTKYRRDSGKPPIFFYAIRELTATRSGSGIRQKLKENGFRDRDDRRSGYGIVVKERGNTGSGSLPPTSSLLVYSNPGSLQNIPLTNQTTYTYKPAQLSLKFHSTNRSLQCKYNPLRLFLGY